MRVSRRGGRGGAQTAGVSRWEEKTERWKTEKEKVGGKRIIRHNDHRSVGRKARGREEEAEERVKIHSCGGVRAIAR